MPANQVAVDFYNAAGQLIVAGPVLSGSKFSFTDKLDGLGAFQFEMPAEDPKASTVEVNGVTVRFTFAGETRQWLGFIDSIEHDLGDADTMIIKGFTADYEMTKVNTLLDWSYPAATDPVTIVTALAAGTGWTLGAMDGGQNALSIRFDGASRLEAIQKVALAGNKHYRAVPGLRQFQVGSFGVDSSFIFANVPAFGAFPSNSYVVPVAHAKKTRVVADVINSIIVLGAGEGNNAFNLQASTRVAPYTIQTMVGPDGGTLYYIEDAASVAANGRTQKVVIFKDIAPLSDQSPLSRQLAANALYDMGVTVLQRQAPVQTTYEVDVVDPPVELFPGDVITFRWARTATGAAGGQPGAAYVLGSEDINVKLVILSRTRTIGVDGYSTWKFTVSDVVRWQTDSQSIVIAALDTLQQFLTAPKLYTGWADHGSERQSVQAAGNYYVDYPIEFDLNMLGLLQTQIRVRIKALRSNVTSASGGGGQTSGSGGGQSVSSSGGSAHNHSINSSTTSSGPHQHSIPAANFGGQTAPGVSGDGHVHSALSGFGATISATTLSDPAGGHTHPINATTSQAESAHSHTVTIASHTHSMSAHTHALVYGVFESSLPGDGATYLYVNGVDRSAALGGPWNADFKVDITGYLIDAGGHPLQQENIVQFRTTASGGYDLLIHAWSMVIATALA